MGRDYKKEYQEYHSKLEQKKNRAKRNKANRNSNCGPGQEVDHKVPLIRGGSNSPSNWRVVSESTNRKKGSKKMSSLDNLRVVLREKNASQLLAMATPLVTGLGSAYVGDKINEDYGKYVGGGLGILAGNYLANKYIDPESHSKLTKLLEAERVGPEKIKEVIKEIDSTDTLVDLAKLSSAALIGGYVGSQVAGEDNTLAGAATGAALGKGTAIGTYGWHSQPMLRGILGDAHMDKYVTPGSNLWQQSKGAFKATIDPVAGEKLQDFWKGLKTWKGWKDSGKALLGQNLRKGAIGIGAGLAAGLGARYLGAGEAPEKEYAGLTAEQLGYGAAATAGLAAGAYGLNKLSASSKKTAASVKKSWWWSEDAPKAEAVEAAAEDAAVKEQLRVAILSGSTGENSKSRALAEAYRKSLEARGAAVDWLDMREMGDLPDVITGDHDKINPYLDRFAGADAYVVASPVYNWGPSGKVKQFMDLAMDSDTMTGKPYSLLSGAGSPRSALAMGGLANQLDMELKGIGIGAGVQVAGKEYNKLTGNVNSAVTARAKANADTLYDVASSLRKTADYPFDTTQLEAFITNTKRD